MSLLGGEPTLHPDFVDFVFYLLERNFNVTVFTSGILSDLKIKQLKEISYKFDDNNISFVCNLNKPSLSTKQELTKIENFLSEFGKYIIPGFNIHELDFDISFIINYINTFQLKKSLRLGLAHPIYDGKNKHIALIDYPKMAAKIVSYVDDFENNNIDVGFDCGMPMCLFSDESIGKFYKTSKRLLNFTCGPAIDIGINMETWTCFPFSYEKKSIFDFDNVSDVVKYHTNFIEEIRKEKKVFGIFDDCENCKHRKKGLCSGGCLFHAINKNKNL